MKINSDILQKNFLILLVGLKSFQLKNIHEYNQKQELT